MIAADDHGRHEEVWLLLPWLANGRIAPAARELAEAHVRRCSACSRELELQNLLCGALTEPDRVTYAPGPSFRKLLDRIDADETSPRTKQEQPPDHRPAQRTAATLGRGSLWRPPGLAWAASFLILFGFTALAATAYRWSEPLYKTRSDAAVITPDVLHIALDRSLTIAEVEEMLRTSGARIVEGPGNTGIFEVAPIGAVSGQANTAGMNRQLKLLSTRLRADPRVLWVEPLADDQTLTGERTPAAQDR